MDGTCTAFSGDIWIASGAAHEVRETIRALGDDRETGMLLVFDDETGKQIDLDMRADKPPRQRGRPRLGVVPGEVTLLPRHWDWLKAQRGGASVTLRLLINEASKSAPGLSGARKARDAAYHFLSAIAGDKPGYEEAIRALYAGEGERFGALIAAWPVGVRAHALSLAEGAWG